MPSVRRPRARCRLLVAVAILAFPGLAMAGRAPSAARAAAGASERLPDLRQEPPQDLTITRVRGRSLLGFRSAVQNVGDGPLVIAASRPGRATRDMRADQLVTLADGSIRRRPGIGFVRYVASPDHSHWHFLPFERYELRREGSLSRVARDRKSGFCLGDRYRAEPRPAGAVPAPVFESRCGLGRPGLLAIREGISVGWGDDYGAYLDSQHIDVTDVPPGRYRLLHTVNATGRVAEVSRANNTASALIALTRANGRMRVRVLGTTGAASP